MKKYLLIGLLSTGFGLMAPLKYYTVTAEMKQNKKFQNALERTQYYKFEAPFDFKNKVYYLHANGSEYRDLTPHEKKDPLVKSIYRHCDLS